MICALTTALGQKIQWHIFKTLSIASSGPAVHLINHFHKRHTMCWLCLLCITAHGDAAVVDPGLGATRDSVGRNATTVVVTDLGVTIETPSSAGAHVPWNNMHAPLCDEEG